MELPDWKLLRERLKQWAAFIGHRRLVGAVGTCIVCIAIAWWIVKPTGAPVESVLPVAGQFVTATNSIAIQVPADIKVYVAGAVRKPGVYSLSSHARVIDAVTAAGGATSTADLVRINLAQVLVDTEQVFVPSRGVHKTKITIAPRLKPNTSLIVPVTVFPINVPTYVPVPVTTVGGAIPQSGSPAVSKVNINTATSDQLDTLPGVGPSTAKAIMAYRNKKGPFSKVEDLLNVPGIGPGKFESMKPQVTVS